MSLLLQGWVQLWGPTPEGHGAAGASPEETMEVSMEVSMLQGLEPLSSRARLGELGDVHPGEEKTLGRPQSPFQCLKRLQENWGSIFRRSCWDRMKGNF